MMTARHIGLPCLLREMHWSTSGRQAPPLRARAPAGGASDCTCDQVAPAVALFVANSMVRLGNMREKHAARATADKEQANKATGRPRARGRQRGHVRRTNSRTSACVSVDRSSSGAPPRCRTPPSSGALGARIMNKSSEAERWRRSNRPINFIL